MRDSKIWSKHGGEWQATDAVWRHPVTPAMEKFRPKQSEDRTFAPKNRQLYYNQALPPVPSGNPDLDRKSAAFRVM